MSETVIVANDSETKIAPAMGKFERYLTLWVALCFIAGIALGQAIPAVFRAIGAATVAEVNLPVAELVWLMIIPMLLKIDLALSGRSGALASMVATQPICPIRQFNSYAAGLIMLATAPCTAMVLVWSNLCHIAPHFTLSSVISTTKIVKAARPALYPLPC